METLNVILNTLTAVLFFYIGKNASTDVEHEIIKGLKKKAVTPGIHKLKTVKRQNEERSMTKGDKEVEKKMNKTFGDASNG